MIAGAAVFVAAYVLLVLTLARTRARADAAAAVRVMLAVATALTLWRRRRAGASCSPTARRAPRGRAARRRLLRRWLLCAALAGACSAIGGARRRYGVGFVASAAGIGLLMLRDARSARAQHGAAARHGPSSRGWPSREERERFARDLHDLLGHSLSVIALKAELAGRLLPDDAAERGGEVGELEQVARAALGEVRDAVSGYRQPTLDGELAGARMALSAAGIEADVQRVRGALDPDVEAVLAWAVREGATNVIRHSGARHCTLRSAPA